MAPAERPIVQSSKPIRKVKPVTQNPWSYPAGNYENRYCPIDNSGIGCKPPEFATSEPRRIAVPEYASMPPRGVANSGGFGGPRSAAAPAPDRFVRDGVTIKLAPAVAPAVYPDSAEESSGSDILSTAAEIIGLPFAFISSFF